MCVVLSVLYMDCCVSGVLPELLVYGSDLCMYLCKDFHVYCEQFSAFELSVGGCVVCVGECDFRLIVFEWICMRFIMCVMSDVLSVCDCACLVCLVCDSSVLYMVDTCVGHLCVAQCALYVLSWVDTDVVLSVLYMLCFVVSAVCPVTFVLLLYGFCACAMIAFQGGYVRGVSVCDCARGVVCDVCATGCDV
ncbi:Pecanex-Like Protein 1 [Manis pentadactyla]|nr:Pecanex-Like Protein 1 [Manis pentadactyla]